MMKREQAIKELVSRIIELEKFNTNKSCVYPDRFRPDGSDDKCFDCVSCIIEYVNNLEKELLEKYLNEED